MKLIVNNLSMEEILKLKKEYGDYVKITVDIEKGYLVVGPELHADALATLKDRGSIEADLWGGWINFEEKSIDMMAVLNIRPQLGNPSMDILDQTRREKFNHVVGEIFKILWI